MLSSRIAELQNRHEGFGFEDDVRPSCQPEHVLSGVHSCRCGREKADNGACGRHSRESPGQCACDPCTAQSASTSPRTQQLLETAVSLGCVHVSPGLGMMITRKTRYVGNVNCSIQSETPP